MYKTELIERLNKCLSITEKIALKKFFDEVDFLTEASAILKINQMKSLKGVGRSSLNTALRFLEFAGILEMASLGSLGTRFCFLKADVLKEFLEQ